VVRFRKDIVESPATTMTGAIIRWMLTPQAFMAVISLREERSPNAISVATSTDIGTASTTIQARFSAISSTITQAVSPFPTS
jgi:hypothetical protein